MTDPIQTVREALERPEIPPRPALAALLRVEAVVKAARAHAEGTDSGGGHHDLRIALAALDPTEAPR